MKKLRLLLATLLAIVGVTRSMAQTSYGIKIGGVEITSVNYTNISSANGFSAIKSGTVTYDPSSKTLTLNGVTIRTTGSTNPTLEFTNADSEPRNMVLVGENTLTSVDKPSLWVARNVTISGNGSLSTNASNETGIYPLNSATLTIQGGCSIKAEGYWGLAGTREHKESLVINGACVQAKATSSDGSICDLASLTLNNCSIMEPSGAVWNDTKHAVCNAAGKPIYNEWVIISPPREPYAVLDGSTLTFYYDGCKASRTGTTYNIPWSERYPEWAGTSEAENTTVTTVDFDSSFAYYHDLVNTSFMFYRMSALTTINNLDRLNTENVTDMMGMFVKCSSLETIDVSHFNTEKVTDMSMMFANCKRLKYLDLTSFNTQNVVDMTFMFYEDFSLEVIFCNDNWYKEDVGTDEMFTYCISLKGAIDYDENKVTAAYANPETGYFTRTNAPLAYAALSTDNTTLTFYYDNQRLTREEKTYSLRWKDYPEWTSSSGNSTITTVNFDASFARYHGLTSTYFMFYNLRSLATINNLENLNTENVTDMSYMFYNCYSLSSLDVSYFNTRSVTNMNYMFVGCSSLSTIICPNDWKKDGITSTSMFFGCYNLVGAISYEASKVTVDYANPKTGYFSTGGVPYAVLNGTTLTFYYDLQKDAREGTIYNIPWGGGYPAWTRSSGNTTITTVDFDASFANYYGLQVTSFMFYKMTALTAINNLDRLNTDNVTDMTDMFAVCNKLSSLDLTNFKTDNVTDMELMFVNCSNLRIIYCNDDWYHTGLSSDDMFNGCSKLGSLALPALDWDKLDANYANPTTGYFTQKASSQQGSMNDNLVVGLIPSNDNKLEIVDNSGEVVSYFYNTAMISIDKGANYVIRAYNNFGTMKTNLFVNGVDRTEELVDNTVDGYAVKELFLRNVEENLVIEARYTPINYEITVSSTEGGETTVYYTNSTNDDTYSSTLNNENFTTSYIKYGTDVRFVIKPNQGYELGFVVAGWNREIGEGEFVVPQGDGSYEFILPARDFNNGRASVMVYYKKVGGSNGDVNGDGEVNIADVTKLVNEILKQE